MNFLRIFLSVWRLSRALRYTPQADEEAFWTQHDAEWLNSVLKTYEGQKLMMRLDNFVINRAKDALKELNRPNYDCHCAEANGVRLGVQAIYDHLEGFRPELAHNSTSEEAQHDEALSSLEPVAS